MSNDDNKNIPFSQYYKKYQREKQKRRAKALQSPYVRYKKKQQKFKPSRNLRLFLKYLKKRDKFLKACNVKKEEKKW